MSRSSSTGASGKMPEAPVFHGVKESGLAIFLAVSLRANLCLTK